MRKRAPDVNGDIISRKKSQTAVEMRKNVDFGDEELDACSVFKMRGK